MVDTDVPNQKKKMEVKFKHLALGARFSYPEDSRRVFVKLTEAGQIVEWDINNYIVCFAKNPILPINPEFLVIIRDSYTGKNNHKFPMTATDEGYQSYFEHPKWCDNPYEEGTQANLDFEEGYDEADWDDCE